MAMRDECEARTIDTIESCSPTAGGHCVTCSDEALEVRVVQVGTTDLLALVLCGEETSEVDISLVVDVAPGDRLLIHGGVAIAKL